MLGCACDKNITLGFELMIEKEGPTNLFRNLQCRDVDMDALQGILVDHACLVDPYILNREADMIEWKLLLVDGAHWNGMKKLKRPDRSGKNGHIGYGFFHGVLNRNYVLNVVLYSRWLQ